MVKIVDVYFPGLKKNLLREALEVFFRVALNLGIEKASIDPRVAGLAQAAAGRRHPTQSFAGARGRTQPELVSC